MNEQYFVQSCGMSLDSLDSEVIALIEDLGLVLSGSVEHLAWITVLENSRYSKYPFCARVKDHQKELHQNMERLKNDFYRRNRKYSRFSYQDFECAPVLFPSERL